MAYSTPQDKIVWIEEFCNIRREWTPGRTVVFTNGCFDILHAGHVDYLQRSRNLGDVLVVGLNTDASVRRLKGASRPVNTQQDRAFVLAGLGCVDYVILFDQDTPLDLIRAVKPQVLVKGGDWAVEDIVGREDVEAAGGEVLSLPLRDGYSTTEMIDKICRMQTKE